MASAGTSSYTQTNVENTTLSDNVGTSTISAGLTAITTSVPVTAATSFPSTNGFSVQVGSEQMTVTAGAGTTTWTVARGVNGTTAATHSKNAPIYQVTVPVTSAGAFPPSGSYAVEVGSEQMVVTAGAGTTTWTVTRGVGSTIAAHVAGALVVQLANPIAGHYYCYEMTSSSASNWTADAEFPATQLGLVMTGLAITNSGTAAALTTGDTVAITFNQQQSTIVNVGSNRAIVCESWDGATPSNMTVFIDHVAYGAGNVCSASPNYDVELTGLTIAHATAGTATLNAQDVVAGSAPWTVTWTLKANGKILNSQTTITGTPSQTVLSTSGGNDISPACTTASPVGLCIQTATGTKF
ncbi:MAG: hypothetical protein ACRDLM_10330 [Gaiellaceae bacterium]